MNRFYIVGTDTGVGKTVFSLILMQYFYLRGFNPFYFKPFQTGCVSPTDPEMDANFIYKHVPHLEGCDLASSVGYYFRNPKAPYFAARDEKREIDVNVIKNTVEIRSEGHNPVIIEGAGGLLVPVTRDILIIDTIKLFHAKPILVARAGLGTINHTLLSLEALDRRDIKPVAVIFMDDADTPEDMIKENMEAVEIFSHVKVSGCIGRIKDFSNIETQVFSLLDGIFEGIR